MLPDSLRSAFVAAACATTPTWTCADPYFLMMSNRQVMPMSKLSVPIELLLK